MREMASVAALLLCFVSAAQDLSSNRPLAIRSVAVDNAAPRVFDLVTLDVDLEAAYENPFDSAQVRLDAEVAGPEGVSWRAPGFLYQAYHRRMEGGAEKLTAVGPPRWVVRLSFARPGAYSVVATAADRTGKVRAAPVLFEVADADVPGMIRRHPADGRYFATDRGETFFPIGANLCWGNQAMSFSYDTWLPQYAMQGCNFFRVWLAPQWFTFAMNTPESGYDRIDLASAWRLDHVLETAETLGMRAMLCIDSFNILRAKKTLYGLWEDTPYHRAHGGPLETPRAYFTDPTMLRAYRDRLRYLVARYGYSPNVFAWEFWNEVDIIDDYDSETVAAWHRDMAIHLRDLDPWKHLITTSFARPAGDPRVEDLPELDFTQTHHYEARDIPEMLGEDRARKPVDRPHFHGEFGICHGGAGMDPGRIIPGLTDPAKAAQAQRLDPAAIHLRNALYACVGQNAAGTPMLWWWDCYVEPQRLYPLFGAFARWIEGFDFVAQHARPARLEVMPGSNGHTPLRDGLLEPDTEAWEPAPCNQPVQAHISPEGILESDRPLSRMLHGVSNHPDWHNPVTFEVELEKKQEFGVLVRGVSFAGGAGLRISVDGKVRVDEMYPSPENAPEGRAVNVFNGERTVKIPKGKHTILVENTGKDWLVVAYRIPWLRTRALRAYGVLGDSRALVWVQHRAHNWWRISKGEPDPVAVRDARLRMEDLAPGDWTVEFRDTLTGSTQGSARLTTDETGRFDIPLPEIAQDLALRLQRAAPR